MTHKIRRVAAIIALAAVLVGAVGLSGGSVAFSQVGQAVSSTLGRLKAMIMELRSGEHVAPAPLPAAQSGNANKQAPTPSCDSRAVMCTARFHKIPAGEQAVWQSLKDQGIDLIQASAKPETYYATLSQQQAEGVKRALTVGPVTSPRVTVGAGGEATIVTDIIGLAWLPTISSNGQRIESSFSFHDGDNGFEIPGVSTEDGGVILVRVKGIIPTGEDMLILVDVGYPQAQ